MTTSVPGRAEAAYQAVRSLNHLTYPSQCELTEPSDVYTVIAALASMIHGDWLDRESAAGRVLVVAGPYATDPRNAAAVLRAHLQHAGTRLAAAGESLSAAHTLLADLAGCGPEV